MDVKKILEEGKQTKFLIKGSDVFFVNALRRTIMSNVSVLAIEDVSVYENNSVLFDEFLCSRLGMLPIKTDVKAYKKGDTVKLILEEAGPKTVYSGDIKCTDPKIEVALKKIPIVKLKEGQRIKLEMIAEMNSGKEHAKWQPGVVSYYETPILKQNGKINNINSIIKSCPKNSVEVKADKVLLVNQYDIDTATLLQELTNGQISVSFDSKNIILDVENNGSLSSEEILEQATIILENKCSEFKNAIKKL